MIFIPSFLRLGTWNIWEEDADFGEKNERLAGAPVIIGRVKKCLRLFLSGPLTVKACERTDIYEILIFNLIFAFRFGYHMAIRYTYLAAGLPCFRVLKI